LISEACVLILERKIQFFVDGLDRDALHVGILTSAMRDMNRLAHPSDKHLCCVFDLVVTV